MDSRLGFVAALFAISSLAACASPGADGTTGDDQNVTEAESPSTQAADGAEFSLSESDCEKVDDSIGSWEHRCGGMSALAGEPEWSILLRRTIIAEADGSATDIGDELAIDHQGNWSILKFRSAIPNSGPGAFGSKGEWRVPRDSQQPVAAIVRYDVSGQSYHIVAKVAPEGSCTLALVEGEDTIERARQIADGAATATCPDEPSVE